MDNVNKLTKEEFLKFLNCSDQKSLPKKFVVKNSKNKPVTLIEKPGVYEADNIRIEESSINKKVVRIPLPSVKNLKNLNPRQARAIFRPQATFRTFTKKKKSGTSSFGRKIKKKEFFEDKRKSKKSNQQGKTFKIKFAKSKPSPKALKPIKNRHSVSDSDSEIPSVKFKPNKAVKKSTPKSYSRTTTIMEITQPNLTEPNSMFSTSDEPTYFLKFNPIRHPDDGKLKYPFEVLVKDIKNMKLPSASWRIKVIVRNSKISSIIFTNKCVLERTVTFTAKTERYEIVLENRQALLLGAPNVVECIDDIEVLLSIIHTINANSPMIYYKD